MKKTKADKDFEYEKKLAEFDIEKFKDLLVRDSAQIEYVRVNITLPKQIAELSKDLYDEPRSKTITSMYLKNLDQLKKERKLKKVAKDLKKFDQETKSLLSNTATEVLDAL